MSRRYPSRRTRALEQEALRFNDLVDQATIAKTAHRYFKFPDDITKADQSRAWAIVFQRIRNQRRETAPRPTPAKSRQLADRWLEQHAPPKRQPIPYNPDQPAHVPRGTTEQLDGGCTRTHYDDEDIAAVNNLIRREAIARTPL